MPFSIVNCDITTMQVDCVVSSSNPRLQRRGHGVEDAIHRVAGPALQEALNEIGYCPYGGAVITEGFKLPARRIIHAVGPSWIDGTYGEAEALRRTYRSIFELAARYEISEIALPVLSAGAYHFPKELALTIAREEIQRCLDGNEELQIYLVVLSRRLFRTGLALFRDLDDYLAGGGYPGESRWSLPDEMCGADDTVLAGGVAADSTLDLDYYAEESSLDEPHFTLPPYISNVRDDSYYSREESFDAFDGNFGAPRPEAHFAPQSSRPRDTRPAAPQAASAPIPSAPAPAVTEVFDKDRHFEAQDKSFAEMVLYWIDERGMTDPECYKAANLSKAVFNKLKKSVLEGTSYKPSKPTAMAYAVALRLNKEEADDLLMRAGFVFSKALLADVIVAYFISHGHYKIVDINIALYDHDQVMLGSV